MRRAVLVLMGFCLLGLSAAMAGSFSTAAEDVTSFTTDVSISVPSAALPGVLYVRGGGDGGFGTLDLVEPTGNDSVSRKRILLDTRTVQDQADPERFIAWRSGPAPSGGWALRGEVTLYIEQNEGADDLMTAALLTCPAAAPPSSVGCTTIVEAVADVAAGGGRGFKDREVRFGTLDAHIPPGEQLRLKVVNRVATDDGLILSDDDWDVQWGYLPSRQSRLEIVT